MDGKVRSRFRIACWLRSRQELLHRLEVIGLASQHANQHWPAMNQKITDMGWQRMASPGQPIGMDPGWLSPMSSNPPAPPQPVSLAQTTIKFRLLQGTGRRAEDVSSPAAKKPSYLRSNAASPFFPTSTIRRLLWLMSEKCKVTRFHAKPP